MSIRKVDLYECDGPCNPMASEVNENGLPEGWVAIVFPLTGRKHLCPPCSTTEAIESLRHFEGMTRIDMEKRGLKAVLSSPWWMPGDVLS